MFDIWHIIPISTTKAMSSYSALLFVFTAITCFYLYKQNCSLKDELVEKEEELRNHTNDEADKLHKKIEKTLTNNSNDLKDLKTIINRMDKTMVGLISDMKYMTKTIDEVKCTVENIRKK